MEIIIVLVICSVCAFVLHVYRKKYGLPCCGSTMHHDFYYCSKCGSVCCWDCSKRDQQLNRICLKCLKYM